MEKIGEARRVHIIYFLCRNGKIDQPHLIRVHHLSRHGVHLRDVKRWLSELRGQDMPECFAWSYKRRYKGEHVWQDLTDDDLITAISDNEYVLKGSLLPSFATDADPFVSQGGRSTIKLKAEGGRDFNAAPDQNGEMGGSKLSSEEKGGKGSFFRIASLITRKTEVTKELTSSDSISGRKAANAIRSFIGCRLVETKGSLLREGRREESSASESSDWSRSSRSSKSER